MSITVKRINRRALELRICENGETFVCRVNSEAGVANAIKKYSGLRAI
jgi:hypothetical protein